MYVPSVVENVQCERRKADLGPYRQFLNRNIGREGDAEERTVGEE
jgi:hypothetical protein